MCNIYSIINDMRSMEEMREEWSTFAEEFGVPVDDWPTKPRHGECARCIKLNCKMVDG